MKMQGDENAFEIIATVAGILKQTGRSSEIREVRRKMMKGDYEHLKAVATEETQGVLTFKE